MEEMEQMNTEELLKQVNTAIRTVLIGGSHTRSEAEN